MLKLNLCLMAWLMVLPIATNASEYEKLHQQQLKQAENVITLADQLFGDDYNKISNAQKSITFKELFNIEQLLNPDRHNKLIQFHHSLSIAFDTHSDLQPLAIYGLTAKTNNRYALKLYQIPQWAEISELFWFLSSPTAFNKSKIKLKQKGLSDKNINLIDIQILQNSVIVKISEEKITTYNNASTELKSIDNQDLLATNARKISDEIKRQERITWFNWVRNLLSKMSQEQQQILFQHGVNNLGHVIIQGTSKSKQKSLDYAQRIISGKMAQVTRSNAKYIIED